MAKILEKSVEGSWLTPMIILFYIKGYTLPGHRNYYCRESKQERRFKFSLVSLSFLNVHFWIRLIHWGENKLILQILRGGFYKRYRTLAAMKKNNLYIFLITLLFISGCVTMSGNDMTPLETVKFVNLDSYVGQWYEIARYHHKFQEGCVGSKATYSLRDDGKINVINECYDKSFSGKLRTAKGKAWVVDKETNARLKVSFFWPFAGDYWIIDLGEDYEYAVIGHPDRKYLWILSRTPEMDKNVYQAILTRLQKQGYDIAKLVRTVQQRGD